MKILHVITMLGAGGAERLLVDLLPLLRERGLDVDLLLLDGVETPFKDALKQKSIKIFELSKGEDVSDFSKVYDLSCVVKLRKYFGQYDIIHTHNTACQFFVPLSRMLTSVKTILVTTEHSPNNRRREKRWWIPLDKWMYNQYAAVICISDQTRANLEQHIGEKGNIHTIYNGVDIGRFLRPVKSISGQSQFVITMVAGLRAEKDHETLLKAMTILPDSYRLQLVGDGKKEATLKSYCNELGLENRISFLGVRLDIPDILEQSDIVVLSSHWEGLSLSSIEGMASGRPFIASDVGGLRAIVKDAGILFPEGDEHALAESIMNLCNNPDLYEQVASRCQEKARKYDIGAMVDGYHELYKSLMNSNNATMTTIETKA